MATYPPYSYWENDIWLKKSDIVIIGGGLVGLSAALFLKEANADLSIVVLERSLIGTAASTRNAGFACYGSPSELIDDLQDRSESEVFELVEQRIHGLELLRSTLGDASIGYRQCGGYEMFLDEKEYRSILDQLDRINGGLAQIDPELQFREVKTDILYQTAGVLKNEWEGQLHPGMMYHSLATKCVHAGVIIHRGVNVTDIHAGNDVEIVSDKINFKASRAIVTTNAFASDLVSTLPTKPGRNMVLITKPINGLALDGCFHYDKGYVYFRNVGDRVLIGGGRNMSSISESTADFGINEKIENYLLDILSQQVLPNQQFEIESAWSGILGFNQSKDPLIQEIEPNLFTAVGLGGMGVAIGMMTGRNVAHLLLQS